MLPQRTVSTSSVIGSLTIGRPSLLNAASASVLASSFLPPARQAQQQDCGQHDDASQFEAMSPLCMVCSHSTIPQLLF